MSDKPIQDVTARWTNRLGLTLQACPGGCGQEITVEFLCCHECFARLPNELASAALAEQILPGSATMSPAREEARTWLMQNREA